ncbi:unnamed protein product [Urochloa humidicola]
MEAPPSSPVCSPPEEPLPVAAAALLRRRPDRRIELRAAELLLRRPEKSESGEERSRIRRPRVLRCPLDEDAPASSPPPPPPRRCLRRLLPRPAQPPAVGPGRAKVESSRRHRAAPPRPVRDLPDLERLGREEGPLADRLEKTPPPLLLGGPPLHILPEQGSSSRTRCRTSAAGEGDHAWRRAGEPRATPASTPPASPAAPGFPAAQPHLGRRYSE